MESCSLDYYALQFSNISSEKMKEGCWLNNLLDQVIALDCKRFSSHDNSKKISFILNQCFTLVPPNNTFLVAKCCQLLLNLAGKQAVKLEKPLLDVAVPWCLQALQRSADIALLDILQALEAVICSSTDNLQELVGDIVSSLRVELEDGVSLTTPQDVKVWRVQCLAALAPSVSLSNAHRKEYLDTIWQLLRRKPRLDCPADAQVLKFALEALEMVSQSQDAWLTDNVGEVLGVVMAFLHFGLQGWQYRAPCRLFPLPGVQWDPPPAPNIKSKTKRRQKKRVSNIGNGPEVDEDAEERSKPAHTPGYMAAPIRVGWITSDSEASDSEGGRLRRLRRTQAHVRLAAVNLLVLVAKSVNVRELFGYYSSLVGSQGLAYSLVSEPNPRLCAASASAIAYLLGSAKSYLSQAQISTVTSYTPFTSVLASLLETLHQNVVGALKTSVSVSVIQCVSCLVDVSPYHRLKPGLLPPLLLTVVPLSTHREVVIRVAALTLLGCVVSVEPHTEEVRTLLSPHDPPAPIPHLASDASCPWVLSAALKYLETDSQRTVEIPVRVEWWQVVSSLVQHHFYLARPHVGCVTEAILRDTSTASHELVRLHATRTFQHLATALTQSDEDQLECVRVWTLALQSQLLGLAGVSPSLASVVCDCLAAMGPEAYLQLPEKLQICCITCALCCARDEEASVRGAAVQALAAFLTFPILSQDDQFMSDCCDVICRLAKDPVPLVSGKAAWALGNLTDMLYKNQHGEEVIPPIQLIKTSMEASQGKVKVKANGVRALGNLLGLLTDRHLSKPEYKDVPLNAAQVLTKNASSTNSMKVSWNACYALGSMLKNEAIHAASSSWQELVVSTLSALVVRSSNFKVRTNASAALSCVPLRQYFGPLYLSVWRAVLEGLENAHNTSDFKEVKHQDGLLEQLCLTLCHLASLVELSDLSSLHEVIVYHLDSMQQHLCRFQTVAVPERTEAVLRAASAVACLRETPPTTLVPSQRHALTILTDVFTFHV